MNKVTANVLSFVRFQSMAGSQSGVHLDPAVLHVGLVSKFDFATAPILLRSTMALIVLGPAPKRGRVAMGHVQVGPLSLFLLSHLEPHSAILSCDSYASFVFCNLPRASISRYSSVLNFLRFLLVKMDHVTR